LDEDSMWADRATSAAANAFLFVILHGGFLVRVEH